MCILRYVSNTSISGEVKEDRCLITGTSQPLQALDLRVGAGPKPGLQLHLAARYPSSLPDMWVALQEGWGLGCLSKSSKGVGKRQWGKRSVLGSLVTAGGLWV